MNRTLGNDFNPKFRTSLDGDYVRADILEFLTKFIATHGYSPSFREIMEACGLRSTASVSHHMLILRQLGKIEYQDDIARSVRVL